MGIKIIQKKIKKVLQKTKIETRTLIIFIMN